MIGQYPPGVVEVDGLDIDVEVEGVLVEENRTTCEVSHTLKRSCRIAWST